MQRVEDSANNEDGSKNGDEGSAEREEGELKYLSGERQVTLRNVSDNEDGNIPAIPPFLTPVLAGDHPPSSLGAPAMPDPPTPLPVPPMTHVDGLMDNNFVLDAPETRVGRKRKTRDLHSMLVVCTCGQAVTEDEISQARDVIMCRRAGCETGWVSQIIH
jgi:hypothetical protein